MSDLLYTLPFKFDGLDAQTSDINDIIRIIREDKVTNSYSIPYITTNNENFNNSQSSVKRSSPSKVSNQKSYRSCD